MYFFIEGVKLLFDLGKSVLRMKNYSRHFPFSLSRIRFEGSSSPCLLTSKLTRGWYARAYISPVESAIDAGPFLTISGDSGAVLPALHSPDSRTKLVWIIIFRLWLIIHYPPLVIYHSIGEYRGMLVSGETSGVFSQGDTIFPFLSNP